MKKILTGIGCVLAVLFALYIALILVVRYKFEPKPYIDPQKIEQKIYRFYSKMPPKSSNHFFIQVGFTDITEYWSFDIPESDALAFMDCVAQKHDLPSVSDLSTIPDHRFITGAKEQWFWKQELWFDRLSDLESVYYLENKKDNVTYFMGYDKAKAGCT